jgi:pyruvate/2-oxoglutarate/acetoin dehydrogenase E1 component
MVLSREKTTSISCDKCRVRQAGSEVTIFTYIKLRLFAVEKREAREFPRLAFDTFIIRLFGRKIFRPFQKKLGFGERTVTAR